MAHLRLEYNAALERALDIAQLVELLRRAMVEAEIFPVPGIRVRAYRSEHVGLADGDPANAMLAMQLYMGAGRTLEQKQTAGQAIHDAALAMTGSLMASGHLMLSLDIFENDPQLSWKSNSVHARLKKSKKEG